MVKLIALYKQPKNKEEFDEHYFNVHGPLTEKIPGLQRMEVTRIVGTPMEKSRTTIFYVKCIMKIMKLCNRGCALLKERHPGKT